ncbi:MAG: hypothetical protein EOL88_00370 [Bacteroidia bacterium]|nr:hypothetical protein [Bacteroidales bacterium]NCD40523.1 hypothetical protein [Bacteroidia bacterium]MDD2322010.1 hypothetical protein [Bacteroidales bacterium]MDD3009966.1 hypothetical protein [Bacteroidales bacterium]MDD3960824.1 hypothetical protein [Bacteroidales bacterium]
MDKTLENLFTHLKEKGQLKQDVYDNTLSAFGLLKSTAEELATKYHEMEIDSLGRVPFEFHDRGGFEFEIRFGGDILLFMMHTNVFELPRDHELFKTTYLKEDKSRSYCGIINIYNFLGDSFKYNRLNDLGYLIGRIFINKDKHYYLEGKRELGLLYNNFESDLFDQPHIQQIMQSAIEYTINFDLLTPPYQAVQQITVYDIRATLDNMQLKTGKRLGFKFQADTKEVD